ncbi:MAG: MucBP domain-containing protein, partial [Oscillospiraceae bacterium]
LKPGENTLNFYYTKTVDTRPEVSVIVNHVYRVTDPNAPGGFVQEAVVSESMKAKAPGEYIAAKELDRTDSDKTIHYTFVESDHPDCKLIVTTVESNNVINLYYTRAYGEGDLFNVHGMKEYVGIDENQYPDTTIYLKQNGEIKYSAPVTGREFTFRDVRPGVYDLGESADLSGYTYTAKYELTAQSYGQEVPSPQLRALVQGTVDITSNPQITVVAKMEYNLEITNTYTRNPAPTPDPDPTPGTTYYGITVQYVDEAGKELSAAHTERHYAGYSYDVTDKTTLEIADYTIKSVTGDTLAGRLNGDKVITVVYAPVVVIPDEPVPEGGKPGEVILPDTEPPKNELPEELEDGAVPLDAAPKTGDTATLWTTLMAVSGFGLAALAIFKGKKKEEDSAE